MATIPGWCIRVRPSDDPATISVEITRLGWVWLAFAVAKDVEVEPRWLWPIGYLGALGIGLRQAFA